MDKSFCNEYTDWDFFRLFAILQQATMLVLVIASVRWPLQDEIVRTYGRIEEQEKKKKRKHFTGFIRKIS